MLALILPQCQGMRSPLFVILHEMKHSQALRTDSAVIFVLSHELLPLPHKNTNLVPSFSIGIPSVGAII